MNFTETRLSGAFILDPERHHDSRGYFVRTFCQRELAGYGLSPLLAQCSVSFNKVKGTLRGMHFSDPAARETKLVRVTRGAVLDVIIDLRPESPTWLQHVAVVLSAENGRALYVPTQFAHGFQALEDASETSYQIGAFYSPKAERGLRHDDPQLRLEWPLPVTAISPKDMSWPLLSDDAAQKPGRLS